MASSIPSIFRVAFLLLIECSTLYIRGPTTIKFREVLSIDLGRFEAMRKRKVAKIFELDFGRSQKFTPNWCGVARVYLGRNHGNLLVSASRLIAGREKAEAICIYCAKSL